MSGAAELPSMVDIVFETRTRSLPRYYRQGLARAVAAAVPGWSSWPLAGIHRLNVAGDGGPTALLSRRTRLILRVPRRVATDVRAGLSQASLAVAGSLLVLGDGRLRELLPWGTLYAHTVLARADDDESSFLSSVREELDRLGVGGRVICGRRHDLDDEGLNGFGLMVDQLQAPDALRVMEHGLGERRALGCGIFVPHKSAAAVGAMP